MELLQEVLVESGGWDCAGKISVAAWWVMPLAVVAAAAVERLGGWWSLAVCELVACAKAVMSRVVVCKDGSDAVGACGWSGPWVRMRRTVCIG